MSCGGTEVVFEGTLCIEDDVPLALSTITRGGDPSNDHWSSLRGWVMSEWG